MKWRLLRLFLVISASIHLLYSGYLLSALIPTLEPTHTAGWSPGSLVMQALQSVVMTSAPIAIFLGFMFTLIMVVEYRRAWKVRHPRNRPITYALSAAHTMSVALASDDCQRLIRQWVATYPDVKLHEIALSPPCVMLAISEHGWWSGEQMTITIHASATDHSTVQIVSESRNCWQLGDLGKNADHVQRICLYLTNSTCV